MITYCRRHRTGRLPVAAAAALRRSPAVYGGASVVYHGQPGYHRGYHPGYGAGNDAHGRGTRRPRAEYRYHTKTPTLSTLRPPRRRGLRC